MNVKDDEGEGDGGEESELKRSSRNLNEKKRRDRFNVLVQEIAEIVLPENERKLDKTTVLKRAINFLQNHQSHIRSAPRPSRHSASTKWQPSFVTDGEFNLIMLEASNSFTLATESNGKITFASQSVLPLLGYRPEQMQGTSLLGYLHEDDALRILPLLSSVEKKTLPSEGESFQLRIKCGNFYSRNTYQVVECKTTFISQQNCIVIVGKVHYPQPNKIVVTSDSQCRQFSYRLSVDWKYVYLDHRASSIIGFLPFELLGTSFYDYCSPEEVFNISQYHKVLIGRGQVTTCYYRHLTKGQSWVWLQSCCYISYNQWNSKPESTTCTATVVHFDEVCANQSKIIQRDREHFKQFFSNGENDAISTTPSQGHSTSLCAPEEPEDQKIDFIPQESVDEATMSSEHNKNRKVSLSPSLLSCLIKTPSDQLIEVLSNHSGLDSEEEVKSSELEWLDNVEIPSGLSSVQLTTHFKLVKEYQKIAEQIRKQERQLKMIRKLIEWSSLLLEFDSNFRLTGDSSADSISVSSSNDS